MGIQVDDQLFNERLTNLIVNVTLVNRHMYYAWPYQLNGILRKLAALNLADFSNFQITKLNSAPIFHHNVM